ncbi:uncharacterized protein LOC110007081 isoform X2 [Amborella trichopoda]|uniref:uncharacterized protein LOC110007081 isoform X2 n=1 Tax=Amborella trichopoda TaxID=13333 RepID=UPI0009BFE10C|nr:uncharacterized protein LOC110007081 isoform X2 [Amborella trichopoda]|eukprot:XP_020521696.1 uncharacterized protein LOC110007081 isoform X2 [Amborella trichopoda]
MQALQRESWQLSIHAKANNFHLKFKILRVLSSRRNDGTQPALTRFSFRVKLRAMYLKLRGKMGNLFFWRRLPESLSRERSSRAKPKKDEASNSGRNERVPSLSFRERISRYFRFHRSKVGALVVSLLLSLLTYAMTYPTVLQSLCSLALLIVLMVWSQINQRLRTILSKC